MKEQITITIDKDLSQMLAAFLLNHGHEWRRFYDDRRGITLYSDFRNAPSRESGQAWLELVNLLEEKADASIPVTY